MCRQCDESKRPVPTWLKAALFVALGVFLVTLLTLCTQRSTPAVAVTGDGNAVQTAVPPIGALVLRKQWENTKIYRVYDPEAEVLCYGYRGYDSVSCMPVALLSPEARQRILAGEAR